MLARVERPDGNVVEFAYDPLGRRISKTYRGKTTRWIWDGNVPLHEWVELTDEALERDGPTLRNSYEREIAAAKREALLARRSAQGPPRGIVAATRDAEAAHVGADEKLEEPLLEGTRESPITWVFEPESFAPLAKLVADERYSIVTDHLGTPRVMFDIAGEVVWSAQIDAYGDLRGLQGPRRACPFRWPGQYEDEETGLYYNRFRFYDPGAGAYVSQDPVGPNGGSALYAYVPDPLTWLDLFGLNCRNAQQELRAIGPLQGRAAADIERDLARRGFTASPAHSGGTIWTKKMPKGQTAAVRIDPPVERTPPRGFADEVPHAHKEIVPTSEVSKRGNYDPARATTLDDAAKKTTDPRRTHIPIT